MYASEEGSTVQLNQSFEFWFNGFRTDIPKRYDIVLGMTRDGQRVTKRSTSPSWPAISNVSRFLRSPMTTHRRELQ
jgi:hypothetical protein